MIKMTEAVRSFSIMIRGIRSGLERGRMAHNASLTAKQRKMKTATRAIRRFDLSNKSTIKAN